MKGRRPYRHDGPAYGPRVNDRIRISPVRLIDEHDQMVGVIETHEALRMAREAGLDLVEVAPDSKPPVCRILDFGKWKYEQARKDKATKSKSKATEIKEVRLGRSMKIDPHDVEIRIRQARKFLIEGHKVQIVQNFRGREVQHRDRGDQRMKDIIEQLSEVGKVEVAPRLNGRRMIMIFAPDKTKIEQLRRREGSGAAGEARPAAPPPAASPPSTLPAVSRSEPAPAHATG